MKINTELLNKLKAQYNFELESGYLYLAYAGYCQDKNMGGFAHFFIEQAKEEYTHAMMFFDYIYEMDETADFTAIAGATVEEQTFTELFQSALDHEKEVTRRIYDMVDLATEQKDYATLDFLKWFVTEQREEEDSFTGVVETLKGINENFQGLYLLNKELGMRQG